MNFVVIKKLELLDILNFQRLFYNGPVLSLARVSPALLSSPPLIMFTKIKLSQQTTKPRVELEHVLQIGRIR